MNANTIVENTFGQNKYGVNDEGKFWYTGMGFFESEAEFVREFNGALREMGLRAGYTSAADIASRGSKPVATLGDKEGDVESVRTRFAQPGQRCGNGVVRRVSDAQIKYMRFLLNTRNYRALIGAKWWPATAVDHASTLAAVETISLKGASTLIDGLLGCPVRASVAEVEATEGEPMASEKQMSYLASLLGEREHGYGEVEVATLTKREATDMIGKLRDAPRKATPAPTTDDLKTIIGIYELEGNIYRMKKARGGSHFYAMILDRAAGDAWNYAGGMARKVPAAGRKLSLDECEALSLELGACGICDRTLTATVDGVGPGARFIGPVCKANMGY